MDEEQPPTVEPNLLLDEDPFCNENTQRLFEAIDGLRSCGANHDIGLPEVSRGISKVHLRMLMAHYNSLSLLATSLLGNLHSCKV